MKRLVGTNVMAQHVAQVAPEVGGMYYRFARAGFGWAPGRVLAGPYTDWTTTVCLLPGDEGGWFRRLVERQGGEVREEGGES